MLTLKLVIGAAGLMVGTASIWLGLRMDPSPHPYKWSYLFRRRPLAARGRVDYLVEGALALIAGAIALAWACV